MLKPKKSSFLSYRDARFIPGVCLITFMMGTVVSVASAQQVSLSLPSGSAAPGGSVTLNLALANSGGSQPTAVQWSMSYPSADISSVSVAAGSAATAASKTVSCNTNSGNATCIVSGMNDTAIASGAVASITFQIPSGATDNSATVQVSGLSAAADDGTSIAASGTGNSIAINKSSSATLSALSCSPTNITTPASATCTVSLTGSAPSSGVSVAVKSNNSNVTVPSSVAIASGQSSAGFTAKTASVSSTQSAVITASANGASKTSTLTLSPPSQPVVLISTLACTPSSIYSAGSSSCTATLSQTSTSKTSVSLSSSNKLLTVPSGISIAAGSLSAKFTATAGTISTQQTAVVTATGPNNSQKFTETLLASSGSGGGSGTISIWKSSAVPGTVNDPDTNSVEVGVKFTSDVAGTVNGVRFYKGSKNTGTHIGHLWTSGGTLLASVTFTNETASGWQQAIFSKPVAITANTTYIISYYCPGGRYASDNGYFQNSGVTNGPLHAPQNTSGHYNGVYRYGSSSFPNQSWEASNYWVDLVFTPAQ